MGKPVASMHLMLNPRQLPEPDTLSLCTLQVEVPSGATVHKKISYNNHNPYQARIFSFSSSMPELLTFHPAAMQLPPGGSGLIGLVFNPNAERLQPSSQLQVLVFVTGDQQRGEECLAINVAVR